MNDSPAEPRAVKRVGIRATAAFLGLLALAVLRQSHAPMIGVYLCTGLVMLAGLPIVIRTVRTLSRKPTPTFDLLVVLITAGCLFLHMWLEASLFVVLALLTDVLNAGIAAHAGSHLLTFAAAETRRLRVKRGVEAMEVAPDGLQPGDVVMVEQGMSIPADGVVAGGLGEIMEASLTGESAYRQAAPGSNVLAGSLLQSGMLNVRVDKVGQDTAMAKVHQLVARAARSPSRLQGFLDRFAGVYVTLVLGLGVLVFIFAGQVEFSMTRIPLRAALARALLVMLAFTPFAIILLGPLSTYLALLRAARRGVVFKSVRWLEKLASVRNLVLDKTGTLTYARPAVHEVKLFAATSEKELLSAALFVERQSSHPVARAIQEHARAFDLEEDVPERFLEFEGGGAAALKGERHVKVGALWFMEDGREIPADVRAWLQEKEQQGYSMVMVADRTRILGGFALEDQVREDARQVLEDIRRMGVRRIMLLTGDNPTVAERVRQALGLDDAMAECMPDKKIQCILNERSRHGPTAMVGDGINDAPALAAADTGLAMGALGSDAALAAAGIALLENNLDGLREAFAASRRVAWIWRIGLGMILLVDFSLAAWAFFAPMTPVQGILMQMLLVGLTLLLCLRAWLD